MKISSSTDFVDESRSERGKRTDIQSSLLFPLELSGAQKMGVQREWIERVIQLEEKKRKGSLESESSV